jgi:hypothetical protein
VLITGIVAASVAVTFDLTSHPTTGAPVIASSVRQTFDDVVRLPTLDISTAGPVSGVSSFVEPTEESALPPSPTGNGGNSDDDATDAMQVKRNALIVLLAATLAVLVVCLACGIALGMYCRKHLVSEQDAQAAGRQKRDQSPALQTVRP